MDDQRTAEVDTGIEPDGEPEEAQEIVQDAEQDVLSETEAAQSSEPGSPENPVELGSAVDVDLPEPANDDADQPEISPEETSREEDAEADLPDEDEDAAIDAQEAGASAGTDEDLAANYELDVEHVRMAEALLFAASEPLNIATLKDRMPEGVYIPTVLEALRVQYENHGVHLINVAGKWAFRTAPDLSYMMEKERLDQRKLSRAAIETLAIIAYHQPVTRAEIEAIRGVSVSKGTVDVLMEVGWIKLRGRRRVPGRPVTYGTSEDFLDHFGLDTVKDLPGLEELKSAGLLDARLPSGFAVPSPDDTLPDDTEDDEDDQDDLFDGDIATPFDEVMDGIEAAEPEQVEEPEEDEVD